MQLFRCPVCDQPAPVAGCRNCGRGHEPLLAELAELDTATAHHNDALRHARRRVEELTENLAVLQQRRSRVLHDLGVRARQARTASARTLPSPPASAVPTGMPSPPPAKPAGASAMAPPVAPDPHPLPHAPTAPVPGRHPELSRLSAQRILLTLGGIVSAVAIIAFAVYAWTNHGPVGRIAVLTAGTLTLLGLPPLLTRYRLVATAETVTVLAMLALVCDAVVSALWTVADLSLLMTAAVTVAIAYRLATGMKTAGYTVTAFTIVAGVAALAYTPWSGGFARLCVLFIVITTTAWWIARRNDATPGRLGEASVTAAGAALVFVATATHLSLHLWPPHWILVGVTASALVIGLARLLPSPWRFGPLLTGWTAVGLFGIPPLFVTVHVAVISVGNSLGVLSTAAPVIDHAWQLPVILTVIAATAWWARHPYRAVVAVGTATTALIASPTVIDVAWPVAAPALTVAAGVYGFLAATVRRPWRGWLLGGAFTLAGYAVLLSLAGPGTTFLVTAGLTVAATLAAVPTTGRARGFAYSLAVTNGCAAVPVGLWLSGAEPLHALAVAALIVASAWWFLARPPRDRDEAAVAIGMIPATALVTVSIVLLLAGFVFNGRSQAIPMVVTLLATALLVTILVIENQWRLAAHITATVAVLVTAAGVGAVVFPDWVASCYVAAGATAFLTSRLSTRYGDALRWAGLIVTGVTGAALALLTLSVVVERLTSVRTDWVTWQAPILLAVVAAIAASSGLARRYRVEPAAYLLVAAVVAAPQAWQLPESSYGWTAALAAVGLAAVACFGTSRAPLIVAAPTALYSLAATHRADPSSVWVSALMLTVGVALVAVLAHKRDQATGNVLAGSTIVLLPVTTLAAYGGDVVSAQPATVTAMVVALLCAGMLRLRRAPELGAVSATIGPVATVVTVMAVSLGASSLYTGVAALVSVGAALLMLPRRRSVVVRAAVAIVPALLCVAVSVPLLRALYVLPWAWPWHAWQHTPTSTMDGLSPWGWEASTASTTLLQVTGAALAATAVVLVVLGLGRLRWAVVTAVSAAILLVPGVLVATNVPWPLLPVFAVLAGGAWSVVTGLDGWSAGQRAWAGVTTAITGGAGLAACLATPVTTIAGFGLAFVGAVAVAVSTTGTAVRVVAWQAAATVGTVAAGAVGLHAGLAVHHAAFGPLVVATALLGAAKVLGRHGRTAEATAWIPFTAALIAAFGGGVAPAFVLLVQAALIALFAWGRHDRILPATVYPVIAGVLTLFAYWILLWQTDVGLVEGYVVPLALVVLWGGFTEYRRRETAGSWFTFAPGLLIGYLPTVAVLLITGDTPLRRLLLGACAVAILVFGAWRRLQAVVVISGAVVMVSALRELALLWMLLPTWLPLGVAGALLLAVGATFEKRRRDLYRLGRHIRGMS